MKGRATPGNAPLSCVIAHGARAVRHLISSWSAIGHDFFRQVRILSTPEQAPCFERLGALMTTGLVYRFGRCELRPDQRQLLVDGRPQQLEPRPFEMLVMLVRHRERLVSKTELLDSLWHGESVGPGSIAVAMCKIRKAIRDDRDRSLIRTLHRVGYRFTAEVTEEPDRSGPADAGTPMHFASGGRPPANLARPEQRVARQGLT
jgi:DNA-binding winged helix-turn-helix (wHTH) protein